MDGSFSRWTAPIPSDLPSPFATEVQENKRVERLLDDFGDDIDMEDRGEDADLDLDDFLGDEVDVADDWIVDDEGDYGNEKKYGKGRQEVGKLLLIWPGWTIADRISECYQGASIVHSW